MFSTINSLWNESELLFSPDRRKSGNYLGHKIPLLPAFWKFIVQNLIKAALNWSLYFCLFLKMLWLLTYFSISWRVQAQLPSCASEESPAYRLHAQMGKATARCGTVTETYELVQGNGTGEVYEDWCMTFLTIPFTIWTSRIVQMHTCNRLDCPQWNVPPNFEGMHWQTGHEPDESLERTTLTVAHATHPWSKSKFLSGLQLTQVLLQSPSEWQPFSGEMQRVLFCLFPCNARQQNHLGYRADDLVSGTDTLQS